MPQKPRAFLTKHQQIILLALLVLLLAMGAARLVGDKSSWTKPLEWVNKE